MKKIFLLVILFGRVNSSELESAYDKRLFSDYIKQVQEAIKERANINVVDDYGYTPLMRAVLKNHVEIVKLLIDNGADLNIKNLKSAGSTALIYSVIDNRIEITQLLIDAKADLDIKDDKGYTALRWCVITNRIKLAHMLINAGADLYGDEDWLNDKDWFDNSLVICAGIRNLKSHKKQNKLFRKRIHRIRAGW